MKAALSRIESLEVLLDHLLLVLRFALRDLLLVVIHFLINFKFLNTLAHSENTQGLPESKFVLF